MWCEHSHPNKNNHGWHLQSRSLENNVWGRIFCPDKGEVYQCRTEQDRSSDCRLDWPFSFWFVIWSFARYYNILYLFLCCSTLQVWRSTSWSLLCWVYSILSERPNIIRFIFLQWCEKLVEDTALMYLWNWDKLALSDKELSCCLLLYWIISGLLFCDLFCGLVPSLWIFDACPRKLFFLLLLDSKCRSSIFCIELDWGYTDFCLRWPEQVIKFGFFAGKIKKWLKTHIAAFIIVIQVLHSSTSLVLSHIFDFCTHRIS